jgi:hypothetical protein
MPVRTGYSATGLLQVNKTTMRSANISPPELPQARNASISDVWLARLSKPIPLTDGRVLRTLDDIRVLLVELPESTRLAPEWQRLGELLLSAAQTGGLLDVATDQLKEAMRRSPFDGVPKVVEDDFEKKQRAPSMKRRGPPKKSLR